MPISDYIRQMLGMGQTMPGVPEQTTPQQDMFYRDPNRYGNTNMQVRNLNRNADLTGIQGYPSDSEYMNTVRQSNLERDKNQMSATGTKAAAKYGSWRK